MLMQQMMLLGTMARLKLREMLTDERGEVNIVAIVVLIGIAVLLALVFKDKIKELLETLFGTISDSATEAVTPETPE